MNDLWKKLALAALLLSLSGGTVSARAPAARPPEGKVLVIEAHHGGRGLYKALYLWYREDGRPCLRVELRQGPGK